MQSLKRGSYYSLWVVLVCVTSVMLMLVHVTDSYGSPTTATNAPVAVISHHGSPTTPKTITTLHGTTATPSVTLATGQRGPSGQKSSTSKPVHMAIVVPSTTASNATDGETVVKTPISHTVSHLNGNKTITTTTYKLVSGHHAGNQTSHLISPIHSAAVAAAVTDATHTTTAHPNTKTLSSTIAPTVTTTQVHPVTATHLPVKSVTVHTSAQLIPVASSNSKAGHISSKTILGSPLDLKNQGSFLTSTSVKSNRKLQPRLIMSAKIKRQINR